jgi:hypothetical protein
VEVLDLHRFIISISGKIRPMSSPRSFPWVLFILLSLLAFSLSGCSGGSGLQSPVATASTTRRASPSPAATPTFTHTSTATPIRTPPTLPAVYQNNNLVPFGLPHTYIQDPCQYLLDKWSSTNSAPGTVVMVIMFHSITNNPIVSPNQVSEYVFRQLMNTLHTDGFQAITTYQLANFLETNASIPQRSVLLLVDDRHAKQYYDLLFRQYWEQWGWPVVNAWISTDLSSADLWQQQVDLNNEGWVDYQAHGVVHNLPMGQGVSDAYITSELQGSIDAFQLHFNKTPIAIIWPGGGFTPRASEIARQLGYRLGFTVNPRGPLMFNWVPIVDLLDPQRPSWIPEGPVNDPLMVLPRYWDTDALLHVDQVIQVGQEAAAYADQNKAIDLEYYDIACRLRYGPIP